jgi:8-oxo-dGTP diphosphatase
MKTIEVTCAVILKEKKILATRRAASMPHPLKWEFPGGKVKQGESREECLVREIREELALEVNLIRALDPLEYCYPDQNVMLFPFICRIRSGTLRLAEHMEYRWLPCDSLSDLDWLDADTGLVDRLKQELCKNVQTSG